MRNASYNYEMMYTHRFLRYVAGLVIFIIAIFLVIFWIGRIGGYKTAEEYEQHSQQALENATANTQALVAQIKIKGTVILNEGKDLGCGIGSGGVRLFNAHYVNCYYRYKVYFVGSGNPKSDISEMYERIKNAGWVVYNADIEKIYLNKLLTQGKGFATFRRFDQPAEESKLQLDLGVKYGSEMGFNTTFAYLDEDLIRQYVTEDKYIYGYVITNTYVKDTCFSCKDGT